MPASTSSSRGSSNAASSISRARLANRSTSISPSLALTGTRRGRTGASSSSTIADVANSAVGVPDERWRCRRAEPPSAWWAPRTLVSWCLDEFAAAMHASAGAVIALRAKSNAEAFVRLRGAAPSREFKSMVLWAALVGVRETLEIALVCVFGNEYERAMWATRTEWAIAMRFLLTAFELRVPNVARMDDAWRLRQIGALFVVSILLGLRKTRPARMDGQFFLIPHGTAHTCLLLSWLMLVLYVASFVFVADPVRLYYAKDSEPGDYFAMNYLTISVAGCLLSTTTALREFTRDMKARYCLLQAIMEVSSLLVMLWQEQIFSLFVDGVVEKQWLNHFATKLALTVPLFYGYFADRPARVRDVSSSDSM